MILQTYTENDILKLGGPALKVFLERSNPFRPNGRTPEQMQEDRIWGDYSEWAFCRDTDMEHSTFKYQDFDGSCNLYGHQLDGIVEIKTISRPEGVAATEAILNYMLKGAAGKKAKFFVVYYADRQSRCLHPFGIYQRGFGGSVIPLASLYPDEIIYEVPNDD